MSAVAGMGGLVRLALRLDRVRLPLWVAALTLVVVSTDASFASLYPDEAARQQLAGSIGTNPALRALYGRLYAPESIGGLTVWRQGAIVLSAIGLLNLLTVTRHTRTAEQTGRLELVAAAPVGRWAPLAAALAVAVATDVVAGTGIALGLVAVGEPVAGAVALGAAVASVGIAFAGVGAVTAQLTDSGRTANGIGGALLAASFVLRAVGDSAAGEAAGAASWVSPVGWGLLVRPFGDERWWVLALPLATGVALATAGAWLSRRRDVGSGMFATRPGPPRASGLGTAPALAWRLQRASLAWWTVGLVVFGAALGAVVDAVADLFRDTPQLAAILERLGGSSVLVDAFLGAILGVFALLAGAQAVSATLRIHAEEVAGHAELVLATATSRLRWVAGHLGTAVVGPAVLLLAGGAAAGAVSGLVTDRGLADTGRVAGAALAHLPAVWVVVGLAVLVIGLVPRTPGLAWGALAAFVLLGQVGQALDLPQRVLDLSPFVHVPNVLQDGVSWAPLTRLGAVAVAAGAIGLVGLRRRDVG